MLGKLMKHEWKAIGKTILLLNLFLIILTILGMISFASRLWTIDSPVIESAMVASLLLYYFSIMGMMIAVTIFLYVRFYKNFYTYEGYLMHTLPVSARSLVLSKIITGSISMLITFTNIFICVMALLFSFALSEGPINFSFAEFCADFQNNLLPIFRETFGMSFGSFVLLLLIMFVLSCISSVLFGYACVSLGQLYAKHKVLGCFISFFGLQMAMQFASVFFLLPVMSHYIVDAAYNPAVIFRNTMFAGVGINIVTIIIYYVITEVIMSRKLNLD